MTLRLLTYWHIYVKLETRKELRKSMKEASTMYSPFHSFMKTLWRYTKKLIVKILALFTLIFLGAFDLLIRLPLMRELFLFAGACGGWYTWYLYSHHSWCLPMITSFIVAAAGVIIFALWDAFLDLIHDLTFCVKCKALAPLVVRSRLKFTL